MMRYELDQAGHLEWWQQVSNHKLLTPDEEIALGRAVQAGDPAARERLITSNLRLCFDRAMQSKYRDQGVADEDLIACAHMGLIRAVDKFDPTRGLRFSTYATWWIEQSVSRAIADQSRTVRLPVHLSDRVRKLRRAERTLIQRLQREPSPDELAAELDWSLRVLDNVRRALLVGSPHSLDWHVNSGSDGDSTGSERGELTADLTVDVAEDAEDQVEAERRRQVLAGALDDLTARERLIVVLRYGLSGEGPMTLQQVGDRIGITRERTRQIEAEALRKLRTAKALQPLRAAVLDAA